VVSLLVAVCAAAGAACSDSYGLSVDLKTDWLPVREFDLVRTEVWHDEDPTGSLLPAIELTVTPESSFLPRSSIPARRIAELAEVESGDITVRVSLVRSGVSTPVGTGLAHVRLEGDTVAAVSIRRSCPTGMECTASECTSTADCPPPNACASPICDGGECFAEPIEDACPTGSYCHPVWGCTPITCDASSSCSGAGLVCTSGRCECPGGTLERSCTDGMDNDCDTAIDCADPSCEGAACGANGLACSGGSCVCPSGTAEDCSTDADDDCNGSGGCQDPACEGTSCGACGLTCSGGACSCAGGGGGESCSDGVDNDCNCETDCAQASCANEACNGSGPWYRCCSGSCADTLNDANNCGGCGIQCRGGICKQREGATVSACGCIGDAQCPAGGAFSCVTTATMGQLCSCTGGAACPAGAFCGDPVGAADVRYCQY